MLKKLDIKQIKVNSDVQPRLKISEETVNEYAELMEDKTTFPPVVVFWSEKENVFWLADGFHRLEAAKKLDCKQISCDVHKGSKREATFFACGANRNHPLTLSREDKRTIIMRIFTDDEWCKMADSDIAKHVGVSRTYVGYMRKEVGGEALTPERKVKRGETEYVMDTSGQKAMKEPSPKASLPSEPLHHPEPPEPEPAPTPTEIPEAEEDEEQLDEATFDKAVVLYRAGYIFQTAMSTMESRGFLVDAPDLQEPAIVISVAVDAKLRQLAVLMPKDTKIAVNKGVESVVNWIETGASKKQEKTKSNPKSGVSPEALTRVKVWERQIGLPPTPKSDNVYAKAFDEIHALDGQPWEVIDEVIIAVKRWKDKGITLTSPTALRQKTGSKGSKKWEAAWMQYRDSDEYKPLRTPPKCPECGKNLTRMRIDRKGKSYMSFFCKEHPEQSFKAGRNYCPEKLVK